MDSILRNNKQIENPNLIKAGMNINIVKRTRLCIFREEIDSLIKEIKATVSQIRKVQRESKPPFVFRPEFAVGFSTSFLPLTIYFILNRRRMNAKITQIIQEIRIKREGGSSPTS